MLLASIKAAILWFCCSCWLTCCTVERGNLLPSENSVCTYIGKGQALSHKTTRKMTFPRKTNKASLSYLRTQPLSGRTNWIPTGSKTETIPAGKLAVVSGSKEGRVIHSSQRKSYFETQQLVVQATCCHQKYAARITVTSAQETEPRTGASYMGTRLIIGIRETASR